MVLQVCKKESTQQFLNWSRHSKVLNFYPHPCDLLRSNNLATTRWLKWVQNVCKFIYPSMHDSILFSHVDTDIVYSSRTGGVANLFSFIPPPPCTPFVRHHSGLFAAISHAHNNYWVLSYWRGLIQV